MSEILEINKKAKPLIPVHRFKPGQWFKMHYNHSIAILDKVMLAWQGGSFNLLSLNDGSVWFNAGVFSSAVYDDDGYVTFTLPVAYTLEPIEKTI